METLSELRDFCKNLIFGHERELWCYVAHRRYWRRVGFRVKQTVMMTDYRCERCGCGPERMAQVRVLFY